MKKLIFSLLAFNLLLANQTDTLSPVLPEEGLPFTIDIDQAAFSLPAGVQAFASAVYKNQWVILAGRTNGLHGFDNIGNNFPPTDQNRIVFVIDPETGTSWTRSLTESGLTQTQIDNLSVTASQSLQKGKLLYLVGGYGINTLTDEMETKSTLTTINLPLLIDWVKHEKDDLTKAIKQTSDPFLQVTGGFLYQLNDHEPFLLMLGQNFIGLYRDGSNGLYTQQIRPFWVNDNKLEILPQRSLTQLPDYRRRDLNIVPTIHNDQFTYTAFAGVFTLDTGVWTVPITINPDGSSFEADPNNENTFKQAMNHYNCPTFELYSSKTKDMYVVFPGGISYGYFSGGVFTTDSEIPFINQVTTVKIDKNYNYTQYLMDGEYPYIESTGTNPGNQLLFGAEAVFIPKKGIKLFSNGVIRLDKIKEPTVIGYIVGGIMSTLANTTSRADSTSSPYVFTVTLAPR